MAERKTVSEAHRAGILSLLSSDYRVEREGDALLLLRNDGSAVAAFRVQDVKRREAKTADEDHRTRERGTA